MFTLWFITIEKGRFMVGGHHNMKNSIKGWSIRKIENHRFRVSWVMCHILSYYRSFPTWKKATFWQSAPGHLLTPIKPHQDTDLLVNSKMRCKGSGIVCLLAISLKQLTCLFDLAPDRPLWTNVVRIQKLSLSADCLVITTMCLWVEPESKL